MSEGEDERSLVRACGVEELRGAVYVGEDQEPGEVVFVGFDASLEDFEAVEFCGVGSADGGRCGEAEFGDFAGATGGIVAFDDLQGGAVFEEFAALHERNGVGVDFSDFVEGLPGEGGDDVRDA